MMAGNHPGLNNNSTKNYHRLKHVRTPKTAEVDGLSTKQSSFTKFSGEPI